VIVLEGEVALVVLVAVGFDDEAVGGPEEVSGKRPTSTLPTRTSICGRGRRWRRTKAGEVRLEGRCGCDRGDVEAGVLRLTGGAAGEVAGRVWRMSSIVRRGVVTRISARG
jgi:hypothetical protein